MTTTEQNTMGRAENLTAIARDAARCMTGLNQQQPWSKEPDTLGRNLYQALGALDALEFAITKAREAVAAELRESGATWQGIGDALGTTKQAAQQRFGS